MVKTILFFGDSLTAGYMLSNPDEESFPARIAQKIKHEHLDYRVVNAGRSGDASSDGLRRLDQWLSDPVDVFVLELGINDIIRGVSPKNTKQSLDDILKRVHQKWPNSKKVILGMNAPDSIRTQRVYALSSAEEINEFKSLFSDLSNDHHAVLVPFFLQGVAGVPHLNFPDGLHPNKEGYKVIADNTWTFIKSVL